MEVPERPSLAYSLHCLVADLAVMVTSSWAYETETVWGGCQYQTKAEAAIRIDF